MLRFLLAWRALSEFQSNFFASGRQVRVDWRSEQMLAG
jgi:hypothetical protein